MRILFRPEAGAEALEAQRWYESRVPGLGLEFARSVEIAVSAISHAPGAYVLIGEGNCRRILLRRFPYSLVYRMQGDDLLVLAIFHHRRSPAPLTQRLR